MREMLETVAVVVAAAGVGEWALPPTLWVVL